MFLQGYLLARPVPAEKLLAVIEALPDHMQSLLLTSPVASATDEDDDSTREDFPATRRRAL